MKKLYVASLLVLASVVTVVAQVFASQNTASWFILHQEETPNCLK